MKLFKRLLQIYIYISQNLKTLKRTHLFFWFCIFFVLFCGSSAVYLVTGAADDGGEDGPGGIVSGEASLHKTGAVVAHECGSLIVVTHDGFCVERKEKRVQLTLKSRQYVV